MGRCRVLSIPRELTSPTLAVWDLGTRFLSRFSNRCLPAPLFPPSLYAVWVCFVTGPSPGAPLLTGSTCLAGRLVRGVHTGIRPLGALIALVLLGWSVLLMAR